MIPSSMLLDLPENNTVKMRLSVVRIAHLKVMLIELTQLNEFYHNNAKRYSHFCIIFVNPPLNARILRPLGRDLSPHPRRWLIPAREVYFFRLPCRSFDGEINLGVQLLGHTHPKLGAFIRCIDTA